MHTSSAARLVSLAACLALSAAAARAQTDEYGRWVNGFTEAWWFNSDRYKEEHAAAARAQWQRIGEAGGAAWAGDYVIDMSVRLHVIRWSPGGGFVFFNVNSCMANVDEIDYGEVVADTPSHVEIASRRHPDAPDRRKFVKVSWGEQRYLIEEHHVGNFCDYVAGLGRYNGRDSDFHSAGFFAHRADGGKPTALLPTVPHEYRELVRRPVDATITRVGRSYVEVDPENEWYNELVTPVWISAGSDQGLRRGMSLHVLDSDDGESVEVTRVGAASSRGIIVRTVRKRPGVKLNEWDDGKDAPKQPIAAGWRLTTSLHKHLLWIDERSAARDAEGKRGH